MKMTRKNLDAILSSIRGTMGVIECLAFDNYPYGITEDKEIADMYYRLNDICIIITKKLYEATE